MKIADFSNKTDFLRKFWDCSGAKVCKSCRTWKMLSNAYFLAKFHFDTAENEPAKNLQNFANFANFANSRPTRGHHARGVHKHVRLLGLHGVVLPRARGQAPGPVVPGPGCRSWSQNISTFILISPRAKIPKYRQNIGKKQNTDVLRGTALDPASDSWRYISHGSTVAPRL